ncbi:MAG: 16S rRNA (guanine(966)-N(2))-methyltransferase RsmD, partial [Burkholderiales bacterium]
AVLDLRPTPDRARETLFNWLGQSLDGKRCLDLFAGSGALGFEAASRGAGEVVLVEQDPRACRALEENARLLGAPEIEIRRADALRFLAANHRRYDIVFLDPPYRLGLLPALLAQLPAHMTPGGYVYLEAERLPEIPSNFKTLRNARAGQVRYLLLQSAPDESAL